MSDLSDLLRTARETLTRDPQTALALAQQIVEQAAPHEPELIPPATYLQAQIRAMNGEFGLSRDLILQAGAGFAALGDTASALRTQLGLMNVLGELGQYEDAVQTGEQLLLDVDAEGLDAENAGNLAAIARLNLGICYEHVGQYENALAVYSQAESAFLTLNMPERVGQLRSNRGLVLLALGQAQNALDAFSQAEQTFVANDNPLYQAQTLINRGEAQLRMGAYSDSLATFAQAKAIFATTPASAEQHILAVETGMAYLALNLFGEARTTLGEVAGALENAGMTHHQARALWGWGMALVGDGLLTEAEQKLRQAEALFAQIGNQPLQASVLLELANLQAQLGNQPTAMALALQADGLVSAEYSPVQQTFAYFRLADLQPDQAGDYLAMAEAIIDDLPLPHLAYRLKQRQGQWHLHENRVAEAENALQGAIAIIETLRGNLAGEATRASFLRDKITAYEALISLYLAQGDAERAFAIAEQAKSRALLDLLTGLPSENPVSPQVAALQAELDALYNQALPSAGGDVRRLGMPALKQRLHTLEIELQRVRLQESSRERHHFDGTRHPDGDVPFPPDITLIAYHILNGEVMAFVRNEGGVKTVRHLCRTADVETALGQLERQWHIFQMGSGFARKHGARLLPAIQRPLRCLYQTLIAPLLAEIGIGGGLNPAGIPQKWAIVPHGLLHGVPFHALHDGEQYLLEKVMVSYAPSAGIFAHTHMMPAQTPQTGLIMGVSDPLIPAVRNEVDQVANHLLHATTLYDEAATRQQLFQTATGKDTVHFACHGLFRGDNAMYSALKLGDGWLTALDVFNLDLRGALVTLSACESGRQAVWVGDEVMGLTRGFLGAGAATLVVSLWLVADETTAILMGDWYAGMAAGLGRAEALRQAQLNLLASHPHPYFWAPFVLVGRR
jgi:tetratricopeptide (TPR) repeat protein